MSLQDDRIEKYLRGDLRGKEFTDFIREMENDVELYRRVEEERLLFDALVEEWNDREYEEISKRMGQNTGRPLVRQPVFAYAAAACFLVLSLAAYWFLIRDKEPSLMAETQLGVFWNVKNKDVNGFGSGDTPNQMAITKIFSNEGKERGKTYYTFQFNGFKEYNVHLTLYLPDSIKPEAAQKWFVILEPSEKAYYLQTGQKKILLKSSESIHVLE